MIGTRYARSTRARDVQRQKVYDTHGAISHFPSAAAKRHLIDGPKVRGTGSVTIEACQAYVDAVTSSAPFQRRFGRMRLSVGHKVSGSATWDGGDISLPPWSRTEYVILHEIAHAVYDRCLPGKWKSGPLSAVHGPVFAAVLLTLAEIQCGKAAGTALRKAFAEGKVKYRAGLAAIPAPSRVVVTEAVLKRKRAAAAARPLSASERAEVAALLRRAAKAGQLGPADRKPRQHALATARLLESAAAGMAASRE